MCSVSWLVVTVWDESIIWLFFFFNDTATTEIYTLSLHDALPIYRLLSQNYFVSYSFKIACAFVLDNELSEIADTRNRNPQSFPNITDVSLKWIKGTLSFCALSSIFLAVGVGIDCEITRSEERRVGKECRSRWSPYH